jgi:hypothetical protein
MVSGIVTVAHQHVEGIELNLRVVPTRVQAVEVRSTIYAEQHSLTVNHKRALAISQRGLDNEGIAVAPVVTIASEKTHALSVTLNDQAVAILLDFVNPVGTAGHLASPSRDAGFEDYAAHFNSDVPGNCGAQPGPLDWKVAG